jgi:putative PIN family toxin of toxin-antitoxin system
VLDTNILVTALRSRHGASNGVLRAAALGEIRLLASVPLFLEWEAVIKRPEHRLVHGFSLDELDAVLADLSAMIEPVELNLYWRPQTSDPGDEMVLEAAVNGRAESIITANRRDFAAAAERFGIRVWSPQEALERLKR